jgi:8-oxo-dGTP diphosphatase
VREMKEEMELELSDFELLHKKEFTDRIEYTYYKQLDLQIEQINLHEGQKLAWFTLEEVANTILAYGSNEILADFASYIKKESASQKS